MPKFMLLESDGTEVIFIIAAVMLAVQLLLCLKVKKIWIRLIPTLASFLLTVVLVFIVIFNSNGLDALGYMLLAIFSLALTGGCAIAWIIWAIIRIINARRNKHSTDKEIE